MRQVRMVLVIVMAAVLTACGAAAVVQKRQTENAQAVAQIKDGLTSIQQQCTADMATHDLDPIRDKVELLKAGATPTPLVMLINGSTATDEERVALLAWAKVREGCDQRFRAFVSILPLPPSMDPDIREEIKNAFIAFDNEAAQGVNYLIAGLYERSLTYKEFNKRRTDLDTHVAAGMREAFAALDAKDRAQVAQRAQAAQQQLEAVVAAAQLVACVKAKGHAADVLCQ